MCYQLPSVRWKDVFKCLNPHALYLTLQRNMKDLPEPLSEYFTTFFECSEDKHTNFPKIDFIKGTCKNNCMIMVESKIRWSVGRRKFPSISSSLFKRLTIIKKERRNFIQE